LRETTYQDLEFVEEDVGDVDSEGPVRNILLRELEDGTYEEVELAEDYQGEGLDGEGLLEGTQDDVEFEVLSHERDEASPLAEQIQELEIAVEDAIEDNMVVGGRNQREVDAIMRLKADMEAAALAAPEIPKESSEAFNRFVETPESPEEAEGWDREFDDEFGDDFGADSEYVGGEIVRTHPYTMAGRYGTNPSTIHLPVGTFVEPIGDLLERSNMKHLVAAAEKAFGGPGFPHGTGTPKSLNTLPQKHIGLEPGQNKMTEIEADAYMAAIMPGNYSAVMGTLVESRKRLGKGWLRRLLLKANGAGPSILDAGAGGAGAIAWNEIIAAEWALMEEEGLVLANEKPPGKTTVLTGPDTLRTRMASFLENTTFLPRLPDYIHSQNSDDMVYGAPAQKRKVYDVVIAPHVLLPLKEEYKRKNMINNLWHLVNPNGGVLILIEKGLPRGFEAVAAARSLILEKHIASPGQEIIKNPDIYSDEPDVAKEKGMIVAPCTNHSTCPMYTIPGIAHGRKDFCHFQQRFIRPPFYQRVLGATHRNHEDIRFSYLVTQRGVDARQPKNKNVAPLVQGKEATDAAFKGHEEAADPDLGYEHQQIDDSSPVAFNTLGLPRIILPPLKRRGHVSIDLCTPSGTLERWTVPKSFSNQAYRDARKSRWGDLWALGAKTRVPRTPKLGKPGEIGKQAMRQAKKRGAWSGRDIVEAKKNAKKGKDVFEIEMGDEGMEGIREVRGGRIDRGERRTKGGRVPRSKPMRLEKEDVKRLGDEEDMF
jgi:ribosomal protein RSM22 (predicted rRNA methylase)